MLTVRPLRTPSLAIVNHLGYTDSRVTGRDVARDGNLRGVCTAAALHSDLGAGDIPLRRAGDVQANLLNAEQILKIAFVRRHGVKRMNGTYITVGNARRNCSGQLGKVEIGKRERVESRAPLSNLYLSPSVREFCSPSSIAD